jgi:hypothetical protein
MEHLTDDERELLAKARAATPGRWRWWTSNSWRRLTADGGQEGGVLCPYVSRSDGHPDISVTDEDMAHIEAAQPATVVKLLEEIERLRILNEHAAQALILGDDDVRKYK